MLSLFFLLQDWLLDGFPRTLGQAKMLDDALSKSGKELNLVVNLDVPEDIILQRIIGQCCFRSGESFFKYTELQLFYLAHRAQIGGRTSHLGGSSEGCVRPQACQVGANAFSPLPAIFLTTHRK